VDGLKLLIADHNRLRGLFTCYAAAEESGDTGRWRAWWGTSTGS
jgi:hypothetical protein